MKKIFIAAIAILACAGFFSRVRAADVEVTLDSSDGSSAFVTKDSGLTNQTIIDSDGNMVIKGGLRLDSSGTKYTTAENLIVDGKIGVGTTSPTPLLHLGLSGTTLGTMGLAGNTSGLVTIQPADAAGTWTLTLPTDDGEDNQFLRTNGAGVTNWTSVAGGSGDVTGPSSSIDNEIALFSGTTGKIIKSATTSGIVKATSGVISAAAAGTDYVAPNAAITGATNTKITYDAKGLVTAGTSALLASSDFVNQGTTTTLLHGNAAGNPSFSAVVEGDISLSDLTTNDVSTSRHGFTPKAPNDAVQFLRGDASWAPGRGIPSNIQVFTSGGTWTKPAGVSVVYVQVWGAGGGGRTGSATQSGGGGGGGGYSAGLVSVSGDVTVTVGSGGAAGNPASAGGLSRFAGGSTLTANGGGAGTTSGGAGGTASGGTINLTGATGGIGEASDGAGGGGGGGSPLAGAGGGGGPGANASNPNSNGAPGTQPGGGGGGGAEQSGTGGAGAGGMVIVMY